MTEETTTTTTTTEERELPCFVRHQDAGGQCQETATMKVYGLNFCERHGEEARLGALMEERQDAEWFFERFRASHVPRLSSEIERGLKVALDGCYVGDRDYQRAIVHAHDAPEDVRERVALWERDEEAGSAPVVDCLLDSLHVLYKLLRIAHAEGETWLVEVLEYERQGVAAQAAWALEGQGQQERKGAPAGA